MARLSTHVLDTSRGKAAEGMKIDLYRIEHGRRVHVLSTVTNVDGRTDSHLLFGEEIATGRYELVFAAAAYFRANEVTLSDPPFLDEISVHFGIANPVGNHHVPLLVSPYGYTTYRGT